MCLPKDVYLPTLNASALPAAEQIIRIIENMGPKLISDSNLTPNPQADTEPQPKEIDGPTIQPSDRQSNIGPPPEKAEPNTLTTPTLMDKIKTDTTTPSTGGAKNDESLNKPKGIEAKGPLKNKLCKIF